MDDFNQRIHFKGKTHMSNCVNFPSDQQIMDFYEVYEDESEYTYNMKNDCRSKIEKFFRFFYDPKRKLICKRHIPDFVFLLVYYTVFYIAIAAYFAVMMWFIFQFIILEDKPFLTGSHSVLRNNPGLSVVPTPNRFTGLMAYKSFQRYSYRQYTDAVIAFTQGYEVDETSTGFLEDCYKTGSRTEFNDRVSCRQWLNIGTRCNLWRDWGYEDGEPCFIIRLNRIYGWLPDPYENSTGVEIKCDGVHDIDKENIGPICYYDDDTLNKGEDSCKRGSGVLKSYYFPYLRQNNYQSPMVIVELEQPKRFVLIMIECWAIAKNIKVDTIAREGSIRFEMYIG